MGESDQNTFAFEKLDLYRCAAEFLATAARMANQELLAGGRTLLMRIVQMLSKMRR